MISFIKINITYFFLILILAACNDSSDPIAKRQIATSHPTNTCTDGIEQLFSKSKAIQKVKTRIQNFDQKLKEITLRSQLAQVINDELSFHSTVGNYQFVRQQDFLFRDSIRRVRSTGSLNTGTFTAEFKNRKLFIKKMNTNKLRLIFSIKEVLNAKLLHLLGIGPKTDLVLLQGEYYLVSQMVKGINLKDIVFPYPSNKNFTKETIDEQLNLNTNSFQEARKKLAQQLLSDPNFVIRLNEIRDILLSNGLDSIPDFQIMVNPKIGPNSIQIIDSEFFKTATEADPPENHPNIVIPELITALRKFAN